ncbi:MAG: cell division protein FtsB [Burkholderiales bacterium]
MRLLLLVLIALVALIQYPLWMGRGGWFAVWDLQEQVASQRSINDGLRARNAALAAEVEDLRSGTEAAEERARGELGMIRNAEVFVQILPPEGKPPESKVSDAKPSGASSAAAARPSEAKPSAAATKSPAPPAKPPVKPPPKPVAKPAPSLNSTPPAGTQPAQ